MPLKNKPEAVLLPDMRFAPPPSVRVADHLSGMNQVLARSFNERLIMSLLLQNDGMTRLELGQESGLSAQTISVIVRSLERDNLVTKGKAVRGRIGPPTTPIALNKDGVFSIGLHIDIDAVEANIVNFVGDTVAAKRFPLAAFNVETVQSTLRDTIDELRSELNEDQRKLIAGIGLTLPDTFGTDAPNGHAVLEYDFEIELRKHFGHEIFIQNDITAVASAETLFGEAKHLDDLLFCYACDNLWPRLILGGRIYKGSSPQITVCERETWRTVHSAITEGTHKDNPVVHKWVNAIVEKFVVLIENLGKFADVPALVLSSPIPTPMIDVLVSELKQAVSKNQCVIGSKLGARGLSSGAATLPIHSKFAADSN